MKENATYVEENQDRGQTSSKAIRNWYGFSMSNKQLIAYGIIA